MNHIRLNNQAVAILILSLVFLLGSCEEIENIEGINIIWLMMCENTWLTQLKPVLI